MVPDDFVKTASELVENSEERRHRAAVHAAYYGVYHLAASYFGLDPEGYKADHSDIRQRLDKLDHASKVPPHIWMAKRHFRDI